MRIVKQSYHGQSSQGHEADPPNYHELKFSDMVHFYGVSNGSPGESAPHEKARVEGEPRAMEGRWAGRRIGQGHAPL